MRGQTSTKFSFDTEPERALHERRRKARIERLASSRASPSALKQEREDEVSVHSEHSNSDSNRETNQEFGNMAGNQPPAER